jgi:hypothetical protein
MATESPPSKGESTLILFFDGSKRGQKSQGAVKSLKTLSSIDFKNSGNQQFSIFREIEQGFSGAVKNAPKRQHG